MAQQIAADGGNERDNKRFTDDVSLADVIEGDRVDPALIPHSPNIEVGDRVAANVPKQYDDTDERTFSVRLIAGGEDRRGDVQTALVYDPEADLFARLGGHTSSGAMSQAERDWKVRDVGSEVVVADAWDIDIPDLEEDGDELEFVEEWVDIAFDNARYGDDIAELVEFDGKKFTFRDYDNREARVQYELGGSR